MFMGLGHMRHQQENLSEFELESKEDKIKEPKDKILKNSISTTTRDLSSLYNMRTTKHFVPCMRCDPHLALVRKRKCGGNMLISIGQR